MGRKLTVVSGYKRRKSGNKYKTVSVRPHRRRTP